MIVDLYISEILDVSESLVISELTPQQREAPEIAIDDKPTVNLYIVDGYGEFSSISGAGGYSVQFVIGRIGAAAVVQQTSWGSITNGWSAVVDLDTDELETLFGSEESIEAIIQVRLTDGSANPRTYLMQRIRLLDRVLPAGPGGPTPTDDYLTTVEVQNEFVQNRSSVTTLTGGGATALDGIATLGISAGWVVAVFVSGAYYHFQLVNGTHAEVSPNFIRPDDYATTTNEKYWQQRMGPALRITNDPNFMGTEGAYDWQPAFDTNTGARYNYNSATSEWFG